MMKQSHFMEKPMKLVEIWYTQNRKKNCRNR